MAGSTDRIDVLEAAMLKLADEWSAAPGRDGTPTELAIRAIVAETRQACAADLRGLVRGHSAGTEPAPAKGTLPACYGKPANDLLHDYQLQRTTPNIYYCCKRCGGGRYS